MGQVPGLNKLRSTSSPFSVRPFHLRQRQFREHIAKVLLRCSRSLLIRLCRSLPQLSLVDFSVLDFATGTVRSLASVGWKLARSKNNLHQPLSSRSSGDDVKPAAQATHLRCTVLSAKHTCSLGGRGLFVVSGGYCRCSSGSAAVQLSVIVFLPFCGAGRVDEYHGSKKVRSE